MSHCSVHCQSKNEKFYAYQQRKTQKMIIAVNLQISKSDAGHLELVRSTHSKSKL